MKKIICLLTLILSTSTFACGDLPTFINDYKVFAEVISQSHMDLELVVLLKDSDKRYAKIVGGYDYDETNLPSCDSEKNTLTDWESDTLARHWTSGGGSSFTSAYRICLYNYRNELTKTYEICNSEVGD